MFPGSKYFNCLFLFIVLAVAYLIYCLRLPEDTYQTAKVVKVLLLMNAGKGAEFKGKKLDEIELNEDDVCNEITEACNTKSMYEDADVIQSEDEINIPSSSVSDKSTNSRIAIGETTFLEDYNAVKTVKKACLTKRHMWTFDKKKSVLDHFKNHIEKRKLPRKNECIDFIDKIEFI